METTTETVLGSITDQVEDVYCMVCNSVFSMPKWLIRSALSENGMLCESCCDIERAKATARAISNSNIVKESKWSKLCPDEFKETDKMKLPSPSKLDAVLNWKFGKKGLLLVGETRTGKSRCIWQLAKRENYAGRSIVALDSMVGYSFAAQYGESPGAAERWVMRLTDADILLLDDIFKTKLTESVESAIFSVIGHRMEHQMPILATTNDTGATLMARMSTDRGPAIIARLREMCNVIAF